MRRASSISGPYPETPSSSATPRSDWGTLRKLLPYLWQYRWRVVLALGFMIGAKFANVGGHALDWLPELAQKLEVTAVSGSADEIVAAVERTLESVE